MEKEDLSNVILKLDQYFIEEIDKLDEEIVYTEDLLQVVKKHNKTLEIAKAEQDIHTLKTKKSTIENVIDSFNEILEYEDINIDDLKKYCER